MINSCGKCEQCDLNEEQYCPGGWVGRVGAAATALRSLAVRSPLALSSCCLPAPSALLPWAHPWCKSLRRLLLVLPACTLAPAGCIFTYNVTDVDGTPTQGGYSTHYVVDKK